MGQIIRPGASRYDGYSPHGRRSLFAASTDIVRRHGFKGVVALAVAAVLAFAPLSVLYWFNSLRFQPVVTLAAGQRVVVKPARFQRDQEDDEPGKTALLQITCEVPTFDGWSELLVDDDPAREALRASGGSSDSCYVRREQVYVRRAGDPQLPFGLLGPPPVSVWLPAGDYEILVVHEAPSGDLYSGIRSYCFPLTSAFAECTLETRQKTVCRVPLPHYNWGRGKPIATVGADGSPAQHGPTEIELRPLTDALEKRTPIPTPGGYVLAMAEPRVRHVEEHHGCSIDFAEFEAVPREWTREQIATVRNWLPEQAAAARERLSSLVDALEWREFFEGWYCYALAAVTGLVFTRWGALAILEPYRRRESFVESLKLLATIVFVSLLAWFFFNVLTDSSGCRGPVPFRLR